jgi:hypothetical protein
MQAPNCLNCDTPLLSQQKFCSSCGQKAIVHRLSLHDVSHDLMHYFTHADKGIFSLLRQLIKKPGLVAKEYVEGKRRKYFSPLNFFLIVAGVYVFTVNVLNGGNQTSSVFEKQIAAAHQIKDPEKKQQVLAAYERAGKSLRFINKYANFVAMFATPFITIFIWLCYKKGKYNYTEHLVANLYFSGFCVLMYALVFGPLAKLLHLGSANFLLFLYFVFEVSYRSISYYTFMNKRTRGSAFKAFIVCFAALLLWVLFTFTANYMYIRYGF